MRYINLKVFFNQDVTGFSPEDDITVSHDITGGSVTLIDDNVYQNYAIATYEIDEGDESGGFVTFDVAADVCLGTFGNLGNKKSRQVKVTIFGE